MKIYAIKITAETKQHRSPIELATLRSHIREIAEWRDDERPAVDEIDITCAATQVLGRYHGSNLVYDLKLVTTTVYCDIDRYTPAIMADVLVHYWLDGQYHYSMLSALNIERYWSDSEPSAYVQDFTESGGRCI